MKRVACGVELVTMDKEKVEELKVQAEKWLREAEVLVNQIPPAQLYAAIGVVLFTVFLFFISNFSSQLESSPK